jgi:hypothetical protein
MLKENMRPSANVDELVNRFNEDEGVWRRFERKRTLRRLSKQGAPVTEKVLEELDWVAAERECRKRRAIGRHAR